MSGRVRTSTPPKQGTGLPFLLHVLVYSEREEWLAHCLEFDAVAQGRSPGKARRGLEKSLDLLISDAVEHGDIGGLFRPAPAELWAKYAETNRRSGLRRSARPNLVLDDRVVRG
ncbi:MAG: hypothetical protein HUU06_08470 [Planctomycetaceae bacterium]|nr:hypothetical protein [Planctomycetaceae bacterium]